MTRDEWVDAHAYLRPIATLCAAVEAALGEIRPDEIRPPKWDDYPEEFGAGIPLLQSPAVSIDFEPAGRTAAALIDRLGRSRLPGGFSAEAKGLSKELPPPRRIVDWLLGDDAFLPSSPGLLRYLGWSAAARSLEPLVREFSGWRDDERWLREYCPTCGSPPAMAQLIGIDPGRKRFLRCGRCRTRWQFGRTRCPFCRVDAQRLAVVTAAGEAGLRIDSCELCKGYLKTLEGQRGEEFLLEDWTSLHLDLLAHDRGLKRRAASLYDLEPLLPASA